MRDTITDDQVKSYNDQGFLVIENFFDAQELAAWRLAIDSAVQGRLDGLKQGMESGSVKRSLSSRLKAPVTAVLGKQGGAKLRSLMQRILGNKLVPVGFNGVMDTNQGDEDSYYAKVYIQCIHLAFEQPDLYKLIVNQRLGKVAARLMDVRGVRLYHDQAIHKPAWGNPTAWHLDNPFWSFFSNKSMTMWVALEDATLNNGCMCYIPGSHKTATTKNLSIGDNFSGLFKLYPQWKDIAPAICPCPAGSVVFHTGMTAHGAGVNMSNKPRKAFAVAFMPEGSTFNGNKDVLPNDYFKSLKVGDLLNNEAVNPLLWSAEKESSPTQMPRTTGPALAHSA